MPAASYGILPNLRKSSFFPVRDGWKNIFFCFVHSSGQMFFHFTPGRLPPHSTGHGVKTVTLGWVGAPNERTPFRIHGAVIDVVDRCPSRSRNLAASNQGSARVFLKPMLAQHRAQICFFRVFPKGWNIFFCSQRAHRKCVQKQIGGYL